MKKNQIKLVINKNSHALRSTYQEINISVRVNVARVPADAENEKQGCDDPGAANEPKLPLMVPQWERKEDADRVDDSTEYEVHVSEEV